MTRSTDDDYTATKDSDVPPKAESTEKYVETLVVVDQKMVHYHGEDAATQFALVVLNIVRMITHFCLLQCFFLMRNLSATFKVS